MGRQSKIRRHRLRKKVSGGSLKRSKMEMVDPLEMVDPFEMFKKEMEDLGWEGEDHGPVHPDDVAALFAELLSEPGAELVGDLSELPLDILFPHDGD